MIHFAISFLFFAIVVVIIFLTFKWLMAKLGWTPDPALMTIIGLIVFCILLAIFLNAIGAIDVNTWGTGLRR